ncbi:carbohydrate ABC transporter permease [Streptomyces sp. NPDC050988]|uniref:carbohydrate ABC transporter permease n=1 Tax=Streptomyces sp. NPDC050988 TaxID=3365637 RepID=UPI0037AE7173
MPVCHVRDCWAYCPEFHGGRFQRELYVANVDIPARPRPACVGGCGEYAQNSLPDDLLDAGRIDGAGFFRLYWQVAMPLFRPALAFLGIFTFISIWNDYIWPLVVMIDPDRVTLQVALANLNVLYNTDYSLVMAGALMSVVPLFLIGARHFLRDLAAGATKM